MLVQAAEFGLFGKVQIGSIIYSKSLTRVCLSVMDLVAGRLETPPPPLCTSSTLQESITLLGKCTFYYCMFMFIIV